LAVFPRSIDLQAMIILNDFPAMSLVTPKPIPLLAPVTMIVLSYSAIFFVRKRSYFVLFYELLIFIIQMKECSRFKANQ